MLNIVKVPNTILTTPVIPVIDFDKKLQKLVSEMEETLNAQVDPPGVGLAAPQVGLNLSLFIIKPTEKAKIKVFVNPKILKLVTRNSQLTPQDKTKKKKPVKLEGCLSIKKIWGTVRRASRVYLEYQTVRGEKKLGWFFGFEAVIIQHEFDHLNGILFTQRVLEQESPLYEEEEGKLKKLEY